MDGLALLGATPWQREKKKRCSSDDRITAVKMMTVTPVTANELKNTSLLGVSGAFVQILWQERLYGAPAQTKSL
jgi:hypothetical protein